MHNTRMSWVGTYILHNIQYQPTVIYKIGDMHMYGRTFSLRLETLLMALEASIYNSSGLCECGKSSAGDTPHTERGAQNTNFKYLSILGSFSVAATN